MAITQAMATSFKVDLLNGVHAFGTTVTRGSTNADTFYIALYTSSATLDSTTTAYSATNEVSGTGYSAGGNSLTVSQTPTSTSTTAWLDFADSTCASSTITHALAALAVSHIAGKSATSPSMLNTPSVTTRVRRAVSQRLKRCFKLPISLCKYR